jgi:aminoglycoside phosphotransferase (APT) family kinase protein
MTHGDLQPGNIIVLQDSISGAIKISGIIDWEMGGWYPEYWDIVKALNTHGSDDDSDWWLKLASMPLFTAYRAEIAIDHLVEASMARP